MKTWKILALGVTIIAAGGAVYWVRPKADGAAIVDEALVVEVKRQDLVIEVVDTGKIEPRARIEVKSKVAGQVEQVMVAEGQTVSKGQLLLVLDPTDHQRDVARAEADVAQAKNALALASLDLERKRKAQLDRAIAEADLDLAKYNVEAKRLAVESAEIARATARDRLRYTRIEAPIAGTVLELSIKEGEVVTPGVQQTFEGRPLLVIGDLSTLLVRAELNQIDIAKVELGQAVVLDFDAIPGRHFQARVSKTAPAAIKPKGKELEVFPVEAILEAPDPAIRPGMTADVRFQIDVRPQVYAVPIEAVVKSDGKRFVTKVTTLEGQPHTEKREVELGARNDRQLEVVAGVSEGERLLIDPSSSKENEVEL